MLIISVHVFHVYSDYDDQDSCSLPDLFSGHGELILMVTVAVSVSYRISGRTIYGIERLGELIKPSILNPPL